MPSSKPVHLRVLLALLPVWLASGCAQYTPEQLAYRDRLESGFLTPEDVQRFRTPDAQRQLRAADSNEQMQLTAQPVDVDLLRAVEEGQVAAVKAALAVPGVSANTADARGNTLLLLAARNGQVELLRLLLKAGADVNGRGGDMPPLAAAALHGHTQAVQLLLRAHAQVNQVGANGRTALRNALELHHLDCAALLLAHGADFRSPDADGGNVLVMAVRSNQRDTLEMLLRQGVPADLRDSEGHSALYWADFYQRPELAALLRAHGADATQMVLDVRPGRPYNTVEQ